MIKVAILGATGFIGKKVLYKLQGEAYEVRYLTRKDNHQILEANVFIGDVSSNIKNLDHFLENINLLINCAGEINDESLMRPTHVNGTANLLNSIENSRPKLNQNFHWIQLSSCGAYGKLESHPSIPRFVDESTQDNPAGEYECTKAEADNLIIEFAQKHDWFKYTIIRPSIVFGHGMKSSLILRIANMVKKSLFFYIGHKDGMVNFVHVDDVVAAMHLAMMNEAAYNQTFIISNDCRLEDFINTIAKSLKKNSPRLIINERLIRACIRFANKFFKLPINESQIDVLTRRTYYNNHKITQLLNWGPKKHILLQLEEFMLDHIK